MSVLGEITKEYFGETVRMEDVHFRWSIDEKYKTRELTPIELDFLNALANHVLYFEKSLFFQIENLQRHTELVLSGMRKKRMVFPDTSEIEMEIAELDKVIKELEGKFKRGEIPPYEGNKIGGILHKWRMQREELEKALKDEEKRTKERVLLGEYFHNNGDDSKVVLYVNNIDEYAGNSFDAMLLMGQVLLHEYFHSFYYHVGLGSQHAFSCAEEPMAEFGSLVVLDSVATSKGHFARLAMAAHSLAMEFVEKKQKFTGTTAAYGFGAYLFDKHRDNFPILIAQYANVSCMIDISSKNALEYKYMLYPKYPAPWLEEVAFEKLKMLLSDVVV